MSDKTKEQTRIEFEVKYPTPAGAMWNERAKCYVSTVRYAPNCPLALHNIRLETWQAAHEMYAPKWISSKERAPQKPGLENYEHVYCWVVKDGSLLERPWNCEHECFDDEDGDDWFCDLANTEFWMEKVVPSLPKQEQAE